LITSSNKDFDKIILKYKKKLEGWQDHIRVNGKNIEAANVEHSSLAAYYDQVKVELKKYVDYSDMLIKKVRGKIYKEIVNNSQYKHSESGINRMIDSHPEYLDLYKAHLNIKEMYGKADAICNAFNQRAFLLTNIVKIRQSELENITVFIEED
jgi:hypothetical protein